MDLRVFHVDAFSGRLFRGNPACVVPLGDWLPDDLMLRIAAENGVAETAFVAGGGGPGGSWRIRWFTPDLEMDLCGHATLASAHVLFAELGQAGDSLRFESASGPLVVRREAGPRGGAASRYVLDFPRRPPEPAPLPAEIADSLNIAPIAVYKSRDYVLEYESEDAILALAPDRRIMDRIDLGPGGVVATAPGKDCDFVSRFFTPRATIFEDPVTGSAHCSLVPFWSARLGKKELDAVQLSARRGWLRCSDCGDRVAIAGEAVTYSRGTIALGDIGP